MKPSVKLHGLPLSYAVMNKQNVMLRRLLSLITGLLQMSGRCKQFLVIYPQLYLDGLCACPPFKVKHIFLKEKN